MRLKVRSKLAKRTNAVGRRDKNVLPVNGILVVVEMQKAHCISHFSFKIGGSKVTRKVAAQVPTKAWRIIVHKETKRH